VDGGVFDAAVDASVWPDSGGGGKDGEPRKPSGPTADPFGPGCSLGGGGVADPTGAGLLMALVVLGWWRRRGRR
jgi:hypothetical protein